MLVRVLTALLLTVSTLHAELVPGLPVHSKDGSVDTSRTLPYFQAKSWPLFTSRPLSWTGMVVDGQGRVWIAWEVKELTGTQEGHTAVDSYRVFYGQVREDEVHASPAYSYPSDGGDAVTAGSDLRRFSLAGGPTKPWCSVHTGLTDERELRIFPCSDVASSLTATLGLRKPWRLIFLDREPVIINGIDGGIEAYWALSDVHQEIFTTGHYSEHSEETPVGPLRVAQSAADPVVLWFAWRIYSDQRTLYGFLSSYQEGEWDTRNVSVTQERHSPCYWYGAEDPYCIDSIFPVGQEGILERFQIALDVGSDGASHIFVPFVQDDYPEVEPDLEDPDTGWIPFSVDVRPQVRAYHAASMDTWGEWTLGYGKVRELVESPSRTQVAVTSGHDPVGLSVAHGGHLDLWLLAGESWYGPYRIASDAYAPIDIVRGPEDRYYLTWCQNDAVYAAAVSLEDLGLESISTAVARPEERRSSPTLAQNVPNPFNAHTVVEVEVPADRAMHLDIFNLRAQLVRSLPLSPGSHRVSWDGTDDAGRPVASGLYLYRLRDGDRTWAFRRMALVR